MDGPSWGEFLKMVGLVGGAILVIHAPIFLALIFGNEKDKKAIYNHHPPGHE